MIRGLRFGDGIALVEREDQLILSRHGVAVDCCRMEVPGFHGVENKLVERVSNALYQRGLKHISRCAQLDVDDDLLAGSGQQRTIDYGRPGREDRKCGVRALGVNSGAGHGIMIGGTEMAGRRWGRIVGDAVGSRSRGLIGWGRGYFAAVGFGRGLYLIRSAGNKELCGIELERDLGHDWRPPQAADYVQSQRQQQNMNHERDPEEPCSSLTRCDYRLQIYAFSDAVYLY